MVRRGLLFIAFIVLVAIVYRLRLFTVRAKVNSWFRSPWRNFTVGGKWNSLHQIGWAFDVAGTNTGMAIKLRKLFNVVVVEKDHIHVQII